MSKDNEETRDKTGQEQTKPPEQDKPVASIHTQEDQIFSCAGTTVEGR